MATPALPPLLTDDRADQLRHALAAAEYTVDRVIERVGEEGQSGLQRNSTMAALHHLGDARDPLACLVRLFVLQQPLPEVLAHSPFDRSLFDALLAAGIVEPTGAGDKVRAGIDILPFSSPDDGATGWVVSDLHPGLDQRVAPMRPDYVLGLSPASTTLAQLVHRAPVETALDLGTGSGVQSLHLASHAARVVATDLNPRALQHARLTMQLGGLDATRVDLRQGSLYEPIADQRFDLIVTNPPYVMSPPTGERLVYREGSFTGDGLVEAVVRQAPAHLNPGGSLHVLGNWANLVGRDTTERLADWVAGSGADLWVIERERLDLFEYIELWLADAGLSTSHHYGQRYREWLGYFTDLGIESVSMGWITLTLADRQQPDVTVESWPWQVEQPVGQALGRRGGDLTASRADDRALLARTWRLRADVIEETTGRPGAEGPEHLVLRQTSGLRRAIECDTALAAVLGASDGELTLGQIIAAVAQLLEVDEDELAADVLPRFRQAVEQGFLD
jgi:methylase of polypeptide subunit release factors